MTQDRPTAGELVIAVREFLEHDVMAATEGRVQFHTRVAVNVLNIVARELELAAGFREQERERATALLGHDGEPDALVTMGQALVGADPQFSRALRSLQVAKDPDLPSVEHACTIVPHGPGQ